MKDQVTYGSNFDNCPLTFALSLIGGKWRLPIIWVLYKSGTMRYNELKRNIEGITNMMLTQSLQELENYQIVSRQQFLEVPPRVEYSLTGKGYNLVPALKSLAEWGKNTRDANKIESEV